jgi:hypothetical protein
MIADPSASPIELVVPVELIVRESSGTSGTTSTSRVGESALSAEA